MANVVVEAQYVADTARYVRSVRQAAEETSRFAREIPQAVQATDQLKSSSIGLSAALGTVGAILGAKALGAVQKYAMQGIEAAKQYEQTVISIEGIFAGTGMSMQAAADKTQTYLSDLRDFAAKTPFELPQVLDAVKRLLSIGYAADDVKDRLLPAVGDIVAALGQPPSAVSAVVYAFGQMKSAGRVLTQDLMQIGTALPGFNAKMALASKLFGGDMHALTKAMESGALDSTKAIDVIIEAMTEFGGAAGAMDRQSKTLIGVMSTFADTVNNALIDGLIPSLPLLSKTLNDVMPEVQALATSFAQALGPALIDGAGTLGDLAPVVTKVIPPIIEMVSQLTSLSDVLVTFAPVLEVAANLVGGLATALKALPAPVYAAIATMLVLRAAMKKLGLDAATMAAGTTGSFGKMVISIKAAMRMAALDLRMGGYEFKKMMADAAVTATGVSASALRIRAALAGIKVSASLMGTRFVATMRSMVVAVKGFMASIGPVGWAIIGVSAAFEILGGKSAATEAAVERLKATVDETTGAFTKLTAAQIGADLRADISPEDQRALAQMGVSIDDMTAALMTGGPAVTAMNEKLKSLTYSGEGILNSWTGWGPHMNTVTRNFEGMAKNLDATRVSVDQQAEATKAAAAINAQASATSMTWNAKYMQARREAAELEANKSAAFLAMSAKERVAFIASAKEAAKRAQMDKTLAAAQAALTTSFTKTQGAMEKLNAFLSEDASMDAARASADALAASFKENGRSLSDHTEKGRANKAAVRDLVKSYTDWAMASKDPIEQQRRLGEGERKLKKQLTDKQYKKLGITQAFAEAKTETQKYADEWKKAAEDASKAGNDVGLKFVEGIIAGLEANKGALETAGAAAGATVASAATGPDGIDARSPSRKGIKLGKDFIDGMVIGLRNVGILKSKGALLGDGIVSAMSAALKSGGTVTDMLSGITGGLPTLPTPLEMALGGPDKVEKWKKKHKRELMDLARMAAELDRALEQVQAGSDAIRSMGAATATPTGTYKGATVTGISDMKTTLGSAGSLDSAMSMLDELAAATDAGYAAMIEIAKKGQKKVIQTQREGAAAQIATYRDEVAGLMIRRQQIDRELSDLEESYSRQVSDINDHYDALDKAAAEALQAVEAKWDGVIAGLEQALTAATEAFDKENAVLQGLISERDGFLSNVADGFRSYAKEIDREGGSFADSFEKRLADVQAFGQNVKTLIARGLDPSIVRDFVQAGVAGAGGAAAQLAGASDEEIARINEAQVALAAEIAGFQAFATTQWFAAGIAQQQAIVAPLEAAKAQAQNQLLIANQLRAQEIEAARAHQEQLRVDREAALLAAQETYLAEKKRLTDETDAINKELDARADSILVYFLALKAVMESKMLSLGKNIVTQMVKGIDANKGALYAKAAELAAEFERTIKEKLGIQSPSREMMSVGEMIAAGLALGMDNGIADVKQAALRLADAGTVVDVGALSPSTLASELSSVSYTGGPVPGLGGEVTVAPGAVQINFPQGSMDNLTAEEIQRIVDDALLRLAREIRRS